VYFFLSECLSLTQRRISEVQSGPMYCCGGSRSEFPAQSGGKSEREMLMKILADGECSLNWSEESERDYS
jgi:hypothetical protein